MGIPSAQQVKNYVKACMDPSGLRVLQHLVRERLAMMGGDHREVMSMPHVHTEEGALAEAQADEAQNQVGQERDKVASRSQAGAAGGPAQAARPASASAARGEQQREQRQTREAARPHVKKT